MSGAAPDAAAAEAEAAEAREHSELLADLPLASFDGLPEDMLCCVCQQPSLDNIACCASGHNACRDCADRLTNGRCPQNCGPLVKPSGNWMRNVPLNSLVRETQLKCGHEACDQKLKLCEIKGHMIGVRVPAGDLPVRRARRRARLRLEGARVRAHGAPARDRPQQVRDRPRAHAPAPARHAARAL